VRRVGLTGGIATGKSAVASLLRARGVPVLDADRVARAVVEPGTEGLAAVVARFGAAVLAPDGSLDRGALGRIAMADPQARAELEAILHPRIFAAMEAWLAEQRAAGAPVAVVDAALMVETGSFRGYDAVLVVRCSPDTQLRRLMDRQQIGEEEARRWLQAQLPPDEKAARVRAARDEGWPGALAVVDNEGPLSALPAALDRAWDALLRR
jgi:dephospho-CoA kinase